MSDRFDDLFRQEEIDAIEAAVPVRKGAGMSDVRRFSIVGNEMGGFECTSDRHGEFVLFKDYAALEAERDELRKLWSVSTALVQRRFRVHGDTVLALEAVTAERDRLQAVIEQVVHDLDLNLYGRTAALGYLRAALEEGGEE